MEVHPVSSVLFRVGSESREGIYYLVNYNRLKERASCDCPFYLYLNFECKHIKEVKKFGVRL